MKIIHAVIAAATLVLPTTDLLAGSPYAPNVDYVVVNGVQYGPTIFNQPFTPTTVSEGGGPCHRPFEPRREPHRP